MTQKSVSPGTGRRERGELMLGFLAELNIVSVALFLKKKTVMRNSKTFGPN